MNASNSSDVDTEVLNIAQQVSMSMKKSRKKSSRGKDDMDDLKSKKSKIEETMTNKRDNKEKRREEKEIQRHVNEETERSTDESENENELVQIKLRYNVPDEFKPVSSQRLTSLHDLDDKELFIIQTPADFNIEDLHHTRLDLASKKTKFHKGTEENTFDFFCQSVENSIYSPVVHNEENKMLCIHPGSHVCGQIYLIPTINIPPIPEIPVPKPTERPLPEGLKIRYVPFGSDNLEDSQFETNLSPKNKRKRQTGEQSNTQEISIGEQDSTQGSSTNRHSGKKKKKKKRELS